jgi:hypothetical protein
MVAFFSAVIAFKWHGLTPRWHRLLNIVVRVAFSWCTICGDTEAQPEDEAQHYDDGCQFLDRNQGGGMRTWRDYVPSP